MEDDFKVPTLPTVKSIASSPTIKNTAEKNHDIEDEINAEEKLIENEMWEPKSTPQDEIQKPVTTVQIECSYKEPKWSQKPSNGLEYKFEVLKSGQIVDEILNLEKYSYWVFGRLPDNHIPMAHPTVSRYHAVLQYRPKTTNTDDDDDTLDDAEKNTKIEEGWYIYDLGSTHGTFLNKMQCPPRTYIRIKVGHMLKLGASSRSFILQGPESDEEPESELSITELKEIRKQKEEEDSRRNKKQEEMREKEGISWGMSEDADEETDLSINPYATTNNEELFLDDPKKTLRGFFEREGLNLEYKCDEMSPGTFVCRIELPIDDSNGKPIIAELCHKGKKKECVAQCALEACRILDRHGILRQSHHEPLKRKIKSDSDDDDDFLDRTGDIERKKLRKTSTGKSVTLTYEDLLKQEIEINEKIKATDENITKYQENSKRIKENKQMEEDDLDNFMDNLTKDSVSVDKIEIRRLRVEQQRLKLEYQNIQKLLKIAKPLDLSKIAPTTSAGNPDTHKKKLTLPLFGKRNKFKFTPISRIEVNKTTKMDTKSDEEEVEPDEMELGEKINKNEKNSNSSKVYGPAIIPSEIKEQQEYKIFDAEKNLNTEENKVKIDEHKTESNEQKIENDEHKIENDEHKIENNEQKIENDERKIENDEHKIENNENKIEKISEWISDKTISSNLVNNVVEIAMESTNIVEEDDMDIAGVEDDAAKKKKQRVRVRNRNRRENIDIDDFAEFEDSEKHAEWVPPVNQKGDGFTKLNEKFGY